VKPPLDILWAVLVPCYDLMFGRLNRRIAKKNEDQLARDIQIAFKFLFADYGAHIVPNHGVRFPPAFDYAFPEAKYDSHAACG